MKEWLTPAACLAIWFAALGVAFGLGNELLVLVACFGFIQNLAYTFVSRGRNSGSLGYHMLASVFSNGIYAVVLFYSIDLVASAQADLTLFLATYAPATMAGSVYAHWLALRVEKGAGSRRGTVETVKLPDGTIISVDDWRQAVNEEIITMSKRLLATSGKVLELMPKTGDGAPVSVGNVERVDGKKVTAMSEARRRKEAAAARRRKGKKK